MRILGSIAAAAMLLLVSAVSSFADDWVAERLRGPVFAYDGKEWVQLKRGDVISDSRPIQTLKGGRVTFTRDGESIEVGSETQIQIQDKKGTRYTTVKQAFGTVTIEAEVQNVQHFEVKSPYVAAVVKGTKFVVTTDDDSSAVTVKRGQVSVTDALTGSTMMVGAGESLTTFADNPPVVESSASVSQSSLASPAVESLSGSTVDDYGTLEGDVSGGSDPSASAGGGGGNNGNGNGGGHGHGKDKKEKKEKKEK